MAVGQMMDENISPADNGERERIPWRTLIPSTVYACAFAFTVYKIICALNAANLIVTTTDRTAAIATVTEHFSQAFTAIIVAGVFGIVFRYFFRD